MDWISKQAKLYRNLSLTNRYTAIVHLEDKEDERFWDYQLQHVKPGRYRYLYYSKNDNGTDTRGCEQCLRFRPYLTDRFFICIDSDLRLLKGEDLGHGRTKENPYYNITRDGAAFLIFKFTGKKAAQFTEAYIKAFNEMDKKLRELQEQGQIDNKPETFSFVEVVDGMVLTTSLKVAKVFEKPHAEILRLISDLDCDYDFRKRNLEL